VNKENVLQGIVQNIFQMYQAHILNCDSYGVNASTVPCLPIFGFISSFQQNTFVSWNGQTFIGTEPIEIEFGNLQIPPISHPYVIDISKGSPFYNRYNNI
jgi:hypothetical protein